MAELEVREAIRDALDEELARDDRVIFFGEDVAIAGGVFAVTPGLYDKYGAARVFDTPISELALTGAAYGAAITGSRPVLEIMFGDFLALSMDVLINQATKYWFLTGGRVSCPLVIRVPIGGYLTGGSIYHSQSGESIFTHTPGVRIVMPSNALDAMGLLRTAIRCDDPVIFLEHKRLYRETFGRAAYPGPEYCIPFGKARIVRPGKDLTVLTYGAVVPRALQAAQKLHRETGVDVELIDLRSLTPYDWEAIAESVKKTNCLLML